MIAATRGGVLAKTVVTPARRSGPAVLSARPVMVTGRKSSVVSATTTAAPTVVSLVAPACTFLLLLLMTLLLRLILLRLLTLLLRLILLTASVEAPAATACRGCG